MNGSLPKWVTIGTRRLIAATPEQGDRALAAGRITVPTSDGPPQTVKIKPACLMVGHGPRHRRLLIPA